MTGRPYSFKKSSSLFFTPDAIVDLLQKLIDVAAVADAIQNEVAQIFAIHPDRAACVLLPALEAVGDKASRGASIAQALRQQLPEQSPPFQAVRHKVAEIAAALQAVANEITKLAAPFQAVPKIATAAGAFREEIAKVLPAPQAIRQKFTECFSLLQPVKDEIAQILAATHAVRKKFPQFFPCAPIRYAITISVSGGRRRGRKADGRGGKHKRSS
jgi:hypothetical protein